MPSVSSKVIPGTTFAAVVGQILARQRAATGIDQTKLATSVGMKQSTWSRVENGQSSLSVEQLRLAANALKTSADVIMREADEASDKLTKHGVQVGYRSNTENTDAVLAILAGTALGVLLVALLSKK